MATHSSILAWRILIDRAAWQTRFHGLQRVRHDWATKHSTDATGETSALRESTDLGKRICKWNILIVQYHTTNAAVL